MTYRNYLQSPKESTQIKEIKVKKRFLLKIFKVIFKVLVKSNINLQFKTKFNLKILKLMSIGLNLLKNLTL